MGVDSAQGWLSAQMIVMRVGPSGVLSREYWNRPKGNGAGCRVRMSLDDPEADGCDMLY